MGLTASSWTRLCAWMLGLGVASLGQVPSVSLGPAVEVLSPFAFLEGLPGVTFSNDRWAVSLHWPAAEHAVELPGLPLHRSGPVPAGTELRVGCRADNGRPGYGVAAATAVLEVRRHPAARATYGLLHPMFWILGLTGNSVGRTPVRVSLTGLSAPFDAVLENPRVYDLGGRLPMRVAGLPAGHVLSMIARPSALGLRAEGSGTLISARFARAGGLAPAAEAMLAHCPPG